MVSLSELGRLKRRVAPTIKILRAENQKHKTNNKAI